MSKAPLISFVVLNWNGLEDTKLCLESYKKLVYPNKELIIVDNGSTDGSKDFLAKLKDVKFIDLPKNTGFTGGHIAGREVAKGEYVALINNDLVLDKHWATNCLATFERHPDAAVVGGKAFKWNDQNPTHNTDNDFYSYQEVDPETGYTRTLLVGEEECVADSISGAALLVKQSCLEKVGYLDNDFFAYYEETDLIARLMRVGLKAYYNPQAHTWHKIAASTSEDSDFYLYMMHRNRYYYAVKNLDEKYLKLFLKNYRREVREARWTYWYNRNNGDAKNRLKAYHWVQQNNKKIYQARAKVQKLGHSYTDRLKAAEHNDVTVIIPCYNYGQYVAEAVQSALDQTVLPKKIIVINDGSTDNSKTVLNTFKDNPLVEVMNKPNTGVIDTKNLGITLSKTYWTVFLDADDKLSKSFIKNTLHMAKNGAKDIVYTDMRLFGAVNDVFKSKAFSTHTLLKTNYINNSALIKTSLLKQVGGYKKEMDHGLEDWELYITLVEAGAKPQYLPLALVQYRQHQGAMSRNTSVLTKEKILIKQIKQLHRGFYKKHGYYRTVTWHGIKLIAYTVRYPGLILVIIKAVPAAFKQALSHIYGKGLAYIQKKIGLLD